MSKEELLKYLIAEIDLIMHDKDYRFENQDGTWYSRESCRDLTNEEVLEELRTELRQFDDLEAKLAEMQNKSFILYSMLYETLEKQGCDNVASQIAQMTGWTYDKEADWLKGNRNYDQLKQQLAEKEKQLENAQNLKAIEVADELSLKLSKIHNQDKISFCIEKLEKVKENIKKVPIIDFDLSGNFEKMYKQDAIRQIDNQIKELKGEE